MELRPYRHPQDREGCLAVARATVPGWLAPEEVDGFAAFLDRLDEYGCRYLVLDAGEEGGTIGCGGLAAEGPVATLCYGLIHPGWHGRGLGRRLLEARLEAARQIPGVQRVASNTAPRTEGFFSRHGFVVKARIPDGWAPGLDRVDMVLDLNS